MESQIKFDPYAVLGVPRDADDIEIKAAFRNVARKHHPDAGKTADRAKFERAKRAQEILLDAGRRKKFDATGNIDDQQINGLDQAALTIVSSLLMQIIASDDADPMAHDLIEVMRNSLKADAKREAEGLARADRSLERITKMRKRFRRKRGDSDNIFESMLDYQEAQIREMIAKQATVKANRDRALEMLDGYAFDKDQFIQHIRNIAPWGMTSTSSTW